MSKNQRNLNALALVEVIAQSVGTVAYVWGGFVADIYSGKLLREHEDTEHLIVDLYNFLPSIELLLKNNDWHTRILENGDLKATDDDIKIHLGCLDIEGDVAIWHHNGPKGYISFTHKWLNNEIIDFMGIQLHSVRPEFQYALKTHPEYMNPAWIPRAKDKADIAVLAEIMTQNSTDIDSLAAQMQSVVVE